MLMPSQSPSSTITIQTLPSDQQQQQQQQQQQEYVDTLNNQKNSTVRNFRREKSMEFDDDSKFIRNINDDINNNHSTFQPVNEIIKSESSCSSPPSSPDEADRQLIISIPSPQQISTPTLNISTTISSNRRSVRPSSTRKLTGEHVQNLPLNITEPDPNVFLISSDTNSHNTIRKTKHDVKRFVMYVDEQFGEKKPLHTISAESLCRYLKHYFENTTKFDGTQYEPDTLRSFLLSIERYLKSKKYEYNLMESSLFHSCRQVIANKREQWKKMGGGNHSNNHHHHHQQSKSLLASLNIKNLTIFDRTKPDGLLLEMYVHLTKLCQDKIVSFAQLLWGDIALIDEQYLVCHQSKVENQTIRLCSTPSQPSTCPVQAYRLYATHRPPHCNTSQSPFFLTPRTSNIHHIWYKTTGTGTKLEQILQNAIQRTILSNQASSVISNLSTIEHPLSSTILNESPSSISILNGKRNESKISSSNLLTSAKRIHSSPSLVQPLNLSVTPVTTPMEDDSGTASSSSPTNSLSNDVISSPSLLNKNSTSTTDLFHKHTLSSISSNAVWDESVTDILLSVAKQRDTRVVKINILRTYLEEKLGVVEFLCLYRGFKSEPKLTFHGTPWEHYQRFLPVLFTLLTLDNTTV